MYENVKRGRARAIVVARNKPIVLWRSRCRRRRRRRRRCLKAPANQPQMRKYCRGNIVARNISWVRKRGSKMFHPQMLRVLANGQNNVSATMFPRLRRPYTRGSCLLKQTPATDLPLELAPSYQTSLI